MKNIIAFFIVYFLLGKDSAYTFLFFYFLFKETPKITRNIESCGERAGIYLLKKFKRGK